MILKFPLKAFGFLLLLLVPVLSRAGNYYVDGAVASAGTGTSWASPYKLLTAALAAAAADADPHVYVAAGSYPMAANTYTFTNKSLTLIGGYNAATGIYDPYANVTTLTGITATLAAPTILISTTNTTAKSITISGFNITGSIGLFFKSDAAAAAVATYTFSNIRYSGSAASASVFHLANLPATNSVTFSGCKFGSSSSTTTGGAYVTPASVYAGSILTLIASACTPVLTRDTFNYVGSTSTSTIIVLANNTADPILNIGSDCIFQNNLGTLFSLSGNTSTSSFVLKNMTFSDNSSDGNYGDIIRLNNSANPGSITLSNCTFNNNTLTVGYGSILATNYDIGYLTIDNCSFTNNAAKISGGCFYINGDCPKFSSTNNYFCGNSTTGSGHGGVYCNNAGTGVSYWNNCVFNNNTTAPVGSAGTGGVIYYTSVGSKLEVLNSSFYNNVAPAGGGAIIATTGFVNLTNDVFFQNKVTLATANGGGAIATTSFLNATNCSFIGNTSTGVGGGIYFPGGASPGSTLIDCAFSQNTCGAANGGGAISAPNGVTLQSCKFINNKESTTGNITNVKGNDIASSTSYGYTTRSCALQNTLSNTYYFTAPPANYNLNNGNAYTLTTPATPAGCTAIPVNPLCGNTPTIGTVTQPSCAVPTGSVSLSGLSATGTYSIVRTPGGVIATNVSGDTYTDSGIAAGSYTYITTTSSGCIPPASASVVINMPPGGAAATVSTITQPSCALATGTVNLSGLPASGNYSLSRTPGGVINAAATGSTYAESGLDAGSYIYTYTTGSGCPSAASATATVTVNAGVCPPNVIDCSKTAVLNAPVQGTAGQTDLMVTVNVGGAGCMTPITISGSGMSLANNLSQVCAKTNGIQQLHIPLKYDGSALGTMTFTIGNSGTCTADLSQQPSSKEVKVWTLDNCTLSNAAPGLQ